jgi:hypothetical protein
MYGANHGPTHEALPTGCLLDGWLLRAAVTCAVSLALVLAQPVASLAWLAGAHATIEQIVLHETALEHGHAHHHGGHRHGEQYTSPMPHSPPEHSGAELTSVGLSLVLSPAAASAGSYHDVLQGSLTAPPHVVPTTNLWHLDPSMDILFQQHFPPVPHRPPIFS